ncbi:MAG TPA: TolC family protein [Thermoanaerobaculia bacterium]|jgi:outer membrane protein TolC
MLLLFVAMQAVAAPQPLSLADASSRALQQASAYQEAVADEQIAALDVTQAHAALLPKVRNSTTVTYNKPLTAHSTDPSFIAENASREYQSVVGVEGSYDFGLRAAVRRSRELLAAAHAGTEVTRRELLRSLRESYFGLALATAKVRAAEESLKAAEEFEKVTALQHEYGEAPDVDVVRARLQTAQRRDDLEQARVQEIIAGATLRVLVGYQPAESLSVSELTAEPSMAAIEPLTPVSILQRPQLAQAAAQQRAAQEDIAVARAERLPSLTYSADEGFDSPSLRPEEIRQHEGYLLTANLRIPIFDWGASRARQRQAEIRAESAARQLTLAQRDVEQQDLRAREEAGSAIRRAANARGAVADAQRNVDISISRYRAGEAPILEVTDALTTLAQQRLNLQQALFDFEVARAQLQEAAGR